MPASVAHPCTSRAEVLAVLREHFPALASEFKLSSLQLFSSFATDEATANSDVDLLASFAEPIGFGFIPWPIAWKRCSAARWIWWRPTGSRRTAAPSSSAAWSMSRRD